MSYDRAPHTDHRNPSQGQKPRAIALKLTRTNHIDPALLIGSALVTMALVFALLIF